MKGTVYAPNTVIDVKDEVTQVFEQLWIAGVTYSYSPGDGAKTQLRCWRKGTFRIGKG